MGSWLNKQHGIPWSACGGPYLQSYEKQVVNELNHILTHMLNQYLKNLMYKGCWVMLGVENLLFSFAFRIAC